MNAAVDGMQTLSNATEESYEICMAELKGVETEDPSEAIWAVKVSVPAAWVKVVPTGWLDGQLWTQYLLLTISMGFE